jgi:hypothetical protein
MTATPQSPPITDELRAQARSNPGGWIYAIDPVFAGVDQVPPEGIIGAWHSSEAGELSEDFTPNPNYIPSPVARGWSRPASELENTLQVVVSGHAPYEHLVRDFAAASVFVFTRPEQGLFVAPAQDGGRLVYAYTDELKAKASGYSDVTAMAGRDLVPLLPEDVKIALNPGAEVSAIIDPAGVSAQ